MASFSTYFAALVQRRDLVYKITTGVYGFPISKEDGYLNTVHFGTFEKNTAPRERKKKSFFVKYF